MTLKYRGTSYTASSPKRSGGLDLTEGRYRGLNTQISLPTIQESIDGTVVQMIYRGVQLAMR